MRLVQQVGGQGGGLTTDAKEGKLGATRADLPAAAGAPASTTATRQAAEPSTLPAAQAPSDLPTATPNTRPGTPADLTERHPSE